MNDTQKKIQPYPGRNKRHKLKSRKAKLLERNFETDNDDIRLSYAPPRLDTSALPDAQALMEKDGVITAMVAAKELMKVNRKGFRDGLRHGLAHIYAVALVLRADNDAWDDFRNYPAWGATRQRPKLDDQNEALRFALRFATGFASRRASKYRIALQPLFDAKVPPADIAARIGSAGGLEAMAAANVARPKKLTMAKKPPVLRLTFESREVAQSVHGNFNGQQIQLGMAPIRISGSTVTFELKKVVVKKRHPSA